MQRESSFDRCQWLPYVVVCWEFQPRVPNVFNSLNLGQTGPNGAKQWPRATNIDHDGGAEKGLEELTSEGEKMRKVTLGVRHMEGAAMFP